MTTTNAADVLIVGAGIAGASLAYELRDACSLVLLEAEDQPGYHATGRSAAFFTEAYGNESIRALTAASRAFFEQPPSDFCDGALLSPRDCVFLAWSGEHEELQAKYAELRSATGAVSLESADFAVERVPILRRADIVGCLWERDSSRIDVHALLQGYLRGFRHSGGRVVTGARVEAAHRVGDVWSVDTTAGVFSAPILVNAAGAWADELASLAGVVPRGLQPMRRTVCLIETETVADCSDWAAVVDLHESFYFMPESGQLLLSPADETPVSPGDAYPLDLDVAAAVDRFEAATTSRVRRVRRQWAGLRTFASDRSPVVGFDLQMEGFFWLAGQGGYGIQTAPALARHARDLLLAKIERAPRI